MENTRLQISLKAARVNAKLSQEQVAKALHVGKQTVVNWEKGYFEPRISQMRDLSELYNMPIDNIFLQKESILN
ncbi:helix-turn-helix transcriptional regulator [Lachnospiraceae bacterium ZAX-1]